MGDSKEAVYDPAEAQKVSEMIDSTSETAAITSSWTNRATLFVGLAVGGVLAYGLSSFSKTGSALQSNRAMRMRVMAQGITVGAVLGIAAFQTWMSPKPQPEPRIEKGSRAYKV